MLTYATGPAGPYRAPYPCSSTFLMRSNRRLGYALAAVSLLWLANCKRSQHSPVATPTFHAKAAAAPTTARPDHAQQGGMDPTPFDLGHVIEQVRFAFRVRGNTHVSNHGSTEVSVDRDGRFEIAPMHYSQVSARPRRGRPLSVQTTRVQRGQRPLALTPPSTRVDDDGTLIIDRGSVRERLRNSAQGLQQSWEFRQRPKGHGPLAVRLHTGGQHYRGRSDSGLHFADARTGLGIRYSRARWVDARGRSVPIEPRFVAGEVQLTVPADVLRNSVFPAVLDPTLTPENGMDTPVHGPALQQQLEPAVASDGSRYLVVWADQRGGGWNLIGARVTISDTKIEDPSGILISAANGDQRQPAVAYDGTHFMVVWQDKRNGNWDIYAARVSPDDGSVLDADGIAVSSATAEQQRPKLVHDGSETYLAVWQDKRNGNWDIYGARIANDGTVQDGDGLPVTPSVTGDQQNPAVAYDGTQYFMVVWQDGRGGSDDDIYGARIDAAGVLVDSPSLQLALVTNDQQSPAIAFDGTHYLVVWSDFRNGSASSRWDIYGARIQTDGTIVPADAFGIPISTISNDQKAPALAYDGKEYLVTWADFRDGSTGQDWDVYGARVRASDAAVLDTSGFVVSGGAHKEQAPATIFDGEQFMVAWQDSRSGADGSDVDVYAAQIAVDTTVLQTAGFAVPTGPNDQATPAVAFDGKQYLVVWTDFRSGPTGGGWDIYGTLVSASGVVSDMSGIAISTAAGDQRQPAVAFDGTYFLAAWQDKRGSNWDIYGARITADGGVVDAAGIPVSTAGGDQQRPRIAFDGTQYLVVWEDSRGSNTDIYGARVTPAGTVPDTTGIAISAANSDQTLPRADRAGPNILVVWQDRRSGSTSDIYGARVNLDGSSASVLDPTGLAISAVSNDQDSPDLSCALTDCLVIWRDKRGGTDWEIYGVQVTKEGTTPVADPLGFAIVDTATDIQTPRIAHDGADYYLVLWADGRNDSIDLYGARLLNDLTLVDTDGLQLTGGDNDEMRPEVVSDGARNLFITFYHADPALAYAVNRVQALQLTRTTDGGSCNSALDCASGHCVDDVCCNSGCGDGETSDCQACSVAAGAQIDGTCGPVEAGQICRVVAGACDVQEACDGSTLTCPTDSVKHAGTSCRSTAGACDVEEFCDGTSPTCPANEFLEADTPCRAAAGDCDERERCTGSSALCPVDRFKSRTTECRAAQTECDLPETCPGSGPTCPNDSFRSDNAFCGVKGRCMQGICREPDAGSGTNDGGLDAGITVDARGRAQDSGLQANPDGGPRRQQDQGVDLCARYGLCGSTGDGGCGCRVDSPPKDARAWIALGLLALWIVRRRRCRGK